MNHRYERHAYEISCTRGRMFWNVNSSVQASHGLIIQHGTDDDNNIHHEHGIRFELSIVCKQS